MTYTAVCVAWEQPRTRRQPASAYPATWRGEFASLPQEHFPLTASVLAGEEQFEIGSMALVDCATRAISCHVSTSNTRAGFAGSDHEMPTIGSKCDCIWRLFEVHTGDSLASAPVDH